MFVGIRFTSWPTVRKTIPAPSLTHHPPNKNKTNKQTRKPQQTNKKHLWIKCVVFWKFYHLSNNAGTVYIQLISQHINGNQTPDLGIESKNFKKVFSTKTLKQCHITKICGRQRCNGYLSTFVYNVLESNFEHLHSIWKYSHSKRVLF